MGSAAGTIADMAKKKPTKLGRPTGRKATVPVYARVDPTLNEVWTGHIESLEPKTSSSAMIELLMKRYLREQGLWPPTARSTKE
jgi:hypothetical protein